MPRNPRETRIKDSRHNGARSPTGKAIALCQLLDKHQPPSALESFPRAPVRRFTPYETATFSQFARVHRDLVRLLRQAPALAPIAEVELPMEPETPEASH